VLKSFPFNEVSFKCDFDRNFTQELLVVRRNWLASNRQPLVIALNRSLKPAAVNRWGATIEIGPLIWARSRMPRCLKSGDRVNAKIPRSARLVTICDSWIGH
jgi:hypothetical protein